MPQAFTNFLVSGCEIADGAGNVVTGNGLASEHLPVLLPRTPTLLGHQHEFYGYDWIDELSGGWYAVDCWGSGAWNLGQWPYIIAAVCKVKGPVWGLAVYTEGDIDLWGFKSIGGLYAQIDTLAERWWRFGYSTPKDLPAEGLGPQHKGPYRS